MKLRRLDQLLSSCGYCSRSECKAWVKKGRIVISGRTASSSDQRVDPREVMIDELPVEAPDGLLALFHKPAGYACSHDRREAPLIYDLLPERWLRRNPVVSSVGRLDRDTTGVLLLTDSGNLIQRWTSPKHKIPKVYEATLNGPLDSKAVDVFASGTLLLDGEQEACLPAKLEILDSTFIRLTLVEGRFHQVKRMVSSQGVEVVTLHRVSFGSYDLKDLALGSWRLLEHSLDTY